MNIIIMLAVIIIFPCIFASTTEKNRQYNERRQKERMLRETMEQVRKGGYH